MQARMSNGKSAKQVNASGAAPSFILEENPSIFVLLYFWKFLVVAVFGSRSKNRETTTEMLKIYPRTVEAPESPYSTYIVICFKLMQAVPHVINLVPEFAGLCYWGLFTNVDLVSWTSFVSNSDYQGMGL
jgi:hypothetical protein